MEKERRATVRSSVAFTFAGVRVAERRLCEDWITARRRAIGGDAVANVLFLHFDELEIGFESLAAWISVDLDLGPWDLEGSE